MNSYSLAFKSDLEGSYYSLCLDNWIENVPSSIISFWWALTTFQFRWILSTPFLIIKLDFFFQICIFLFVLLSSYFNFILWIQFGFSLFFLSSAALLWQLVLMENRYPSLQLKSQSCLLFLECQEWRYSFFGWKSYFLLCSKFLNFVYFLVFWSISNC